MSPPVMATSTAKRFPQSPSTRSGFKIISPSVAIRSVIIFCLVSFSCKRSAAKIKTKTGVSESMSAMFCIGAKL